MAHTTDERIARLLPLCSYGPDYNRNVNAALADHKLFAGRGEVTSAEHYLLLAEVRAGLITWDEYVAADPFTRPAVTAEVAEGTDLLETGF